MKHRHLIDADALIAQMEADAEQMEEPIAKMFTYAAINDVKHAPTIELRCEECEAFHKTRLLIPQPERKKGKWKRRLVDGGFNADWHCSECGWKTSLEEHGYNFCPNCGSDNRGEQDENN